MLKTVLCSQGQTLVNREVGSYLQLSSSPRELQVGKMVRWPESVLPTVNLHPEIQQLQAATLLAANRLEVLIGFIQCELMTKK